MKLQPVSQAFRASPDLFPVSDVQPIISKPYHSVSKGSMIGFRSLLGD